MQVVVVLIAIVVLLGALFWAWPLAVGIVVFLGLKTVFEDKLDPSRKVKAPLAVVVAVLAIGAMAWWIPVASDLTNDPAPADPESDNSYVPQDYDSDYSDSSGYDSYDSSDYDSSGYDSSGYDSYDYGSGGDPTDVGDVADTCAVASQSSNMTVKECMEAFGF